MVITQIRRNKEKIRKFKIEKMKNNCFYMLFIFICTWTSIFGEINDNKRKLKGRNSK